MKFYPWSNEVEVRDWRVGDTLLVVDEAPRNCDKEFSAGERLTLRAHARGHDDVFVSPDAAGYSRSRARFRNLSLEARQMPRPGFVGGRSNTLPTDPAERKAVPVVTGCLDYFPAALAEVARVSKAGNDQHNPGQPMHHARGKSTDHADCAGRHLMERGTRDTDGHRHTAKLAWRALALLQEELEAEGAPLARGARLP